MCNCINELEEKILAHVTEQKKYKKPVKNVSFKDKIMVFGDSLSSKTMSLFQIELEGQNKKIEMPVTHSFCPFCGENKLSSKSENQNA